MEVQEPDQFHHYTIHGFDIRQLNEVFIQKHAEEEFNPLLRGFPDLKAVLAEIDLIQFAPSVPNPGNLVISVVQTQQSLRISCSCASQAKKLCRHQSRALFTLATQEDLRLFFDPLLRREKLSKFAVQYGLEAETHLEDYFLVEYSDQKTLVKPVSPHLVPTIRESVLAIGDQLKKGNLNPVRASPEGHQLAVVFRHHRYYRHLAIELLEGPTTQLGKLKNPLLAIPAIEKVWRSETEVESKFFSALSLFAKRNSSEEPRVYLEALKAILKNPLAFPFYRHLPEISENLVAASLKPLNIGTIARDLHIKVEKADPFYQITGTVILNGTTYRMEEVKVAYEYFIETPSEVHLVGNLKMLQVIALLKQYDNKLLIHTSKYERFNEEILTSLEETTAVEYAYLPPATTRQLEEHNLNHPPEKLIYLTDSDPFIHINPVMKYGNIEIPVLSKKLIYPKGIKTGFIVKRDKEAEVAFTALLLKQHSWFEEQLEDSLPYFYLHKKHFLNEEWFLNAFEEWQNHAISILGFDKISENRLNPNKAQVTIRVLSGTDWFNADVDVRYGKKKASLLQLKKALRNKSKYIQLDDGTLGILPQEWIRKFADYFQAGEIVEDTFRIPRSNFSIIQELFDDEMIDEQVKSELAILNEKLTIFEGIDEVEAPKELNASLREYQKQGLNWLNFLDDFNLGGCLADDMGLGKSIQILAFILTQRGKSASNTNLLVVPTSLIFNWQLEINKFAPSLRILILHGSNRRVRLEEFPDYEVIITSYGTLLSDIRYLKKFCFNYVFLDESQNIKNPDSQRYKAACLLRSRNRIVISGTPLENNTFDLYGQLSFACPGLLGSKSYFKDIYFIPIDRFQDRKRALELQNKIKPFVLRRTKKAVASELPEKTEMVLYCEMGVEQRKVYDAYEREFREFICSKTSEELPRSAANVLRGLTRLRQICNSPLLLQDEEIDERSSAKIDTLVEQILTKSPNHKILIFSQFVTMLDLVKKELDARGVAHSYLTGRTRNREQVVQEFQTDKNRRVFLISLKAGGVGLNLTQADYVYLIDPWWNPAVENQAIDRIYRIGQKKNVMAVRLICTHSIEEKIMQLQESKKDLFQDLITSDTAMVKGLTKEQLLNLLS